MGSKIDDLSSALRLLERALGTELIRKEVHKMQSWNPEGVQGLHPLVLLWYKSREDLGVAELTGNLPRSRWIEETLELGSLLEKSPNSTDATQILAEYVSKKQKVKTSKLS